MSNSRMSPSRLTRYLCALSKGGGVQCRRNCSHKCQFSLIISAFVQKRNLVLSIHLCIIHTYPWTSSFYVETSYDDHKIPESDDWLRSCFWALNKDKENLIKFSQAHGTASKQRQQQRQPYMVKCEDDNIIILMLEKGHNFIRFFIALSAFHRHEQKCILKYIENSVIRPFFINSF